MSVWTLGALILLVIVGVMGFLVYMAMEGSVVAIIILTAIGFMLMFGVFQGFNLSYQLLRDRAEHRRMQEDLKEDLIMMQHAFKAQNIQASAQQKLYAGHVTGQKLIGGPTASVDTDLFSDFEEVD